LSQQGANQQPLQQQELSMYGKMVTPMDSDCDGHTASSALAETSMSLMPWEFHEPVRKNMLLLVESTLVKVLLTLLAVIGVVAP
jgi:hypothetical protein